MKKKYETPAMEIVEIESAYLLSGSGEKTIRVFDDDDDIDMSPSSAW